MLIHILHIGVDSFGRANRIIPQVLQVFAEYERKIIAARTRAAMLHHQANGRRMSHVCPYGWVRDPDHEDLLYEVPEEQAVIRQIIELYQAGNGLVGREQVDCVVGNRF